jgi:hypothetical protein
MLKQCFIKFFSTISAGEIVFLLLCERVFPKSHVIQSSIVVWPAVNNWKDVTGNSGALFKLLLQHLIRNQRNSYQNRFIWTQSEAEMSEIEAGILFITQRQFVF